MRTRLALLYGGLFVASGAAVVAFVDALILGRVAAPPPPGGGRTRHAVPSNLPGHRVFSDFSHHQVLLDSAIALALMAVLCALLGWMVAGRVLRPFRKIVATARHISVFSLHERLNLDGPYDEFVELGDTLDDLFGRLETSFESQRHFVANASHELRTPLTVEKALLQVALADPKATVSGLRATCEEVLTIGAQQERLVDALLTLASSEREIERWDTVDLAALTEKVLLVRRHEIEQRSLGLTLVLHPADATGDSNLIESLMGNLIDNAIRHNVPGGHIEISTAAAGGRALFRVDNTGAMVPPGDMERLFQPFQRLDDRRTGAGDGHGLGLAIVSGIARANHAVLTARPRAGGGLAVEVTFDVRR
ncbi:MAG: HAMP domain-containing sensor histidine kinase [Acidimicrobiales bacterium]